MRILQLISSNGFYGAENVVTLLSSRLMNRGCTVKIGLLNASKMPPQDLRRFGEEIGSPPWDFGCGGRFSPSAVVRLISFLRSQKIDVLHTHGYKANIYGLIAARLAGCASIATCHNWTDRTAALHRYGLIDKRVLRGFGSVVAVSDRVYSMLEEEGFRKSKLRLIYNGVDTGKYRAASGNVTRSKIIIGALSRLSHEKGIDVLLRALPRVLERYPDAKCIVTGEGSERGQLLALAEDLGVARSVQLPGFQSDTVGFLARCTIVTQPSRTEGMPLAILEAMAAGKPIVASAVGAMPTLLRDGLAGILVPSEDPAALATGILKMLGDPALRERCGVHAAAFALKNFDASVMADKYIKAYYELLGIDNLTARAPRPPDTYEPVQRLGPSTSIATELP